MAELQSEATIKRTVRAVLLSSKHGCTPRQLANDYAHIIGESIPFESFGYSSLMKFIMSMPDVVRVERGRDRTMLYGIPDQRTEHIAKMVANQRSVKRMTSIATVRLGNSHWSRSFQPKVPHTFRLQLKTLMLSYSSGLSVRNFMEAFARRFGYYLNYKAWGFSDLILLLRAVPDIISLENDKITMVPKSPSVALSPSNKMDDKLEKLMSFEVPKPIDVPPRPKPRDSLHSLELSPGKSFLTELKSPPPPPPPRQRKNPTVPQQLIGKVDDLLRAHQGGIWASRFPLEFKDYFDEDLSISSLGFMNVVHLLSSLPLCDLQRPSGTGDWLVFRRGYKETNLEYPPLDHGGLLYISEDLAKSIRVLLQTQPDNCIPLSKFSQVFKETFHQDLPVEEIGFKSVAEMVKQVPGVSVLKPDGSSPVLVCCSTVGERRKEEEEQGTGEEAPRDKPTVKTLPSAYAKLPIPKDQKMCGVYVTWVKTPSCVCVQLIGESTTKCLEYLLEDITQFYNSKAGDAYRIKEPEIGQPCCTMFANDGYWYRAEIMSLPASDIVEVRYMDYGNTGQVPLGAIRKPKPHYLALPAQALECRLANLKPAGSTWSRRATQLLFQMTKDKPIMAMITSIAGDCMSVCLCDTTTERDIHINDTLVSQGLALFTPDTEEDKESYDGFQLESAPQGSTGDVVPEVRPPSSPSKVEAADSSSATTQQKIAASQFQMQSYLQQLLLLQQQQNVLLLTQPNLLQPGVVPSPPLAQPGVDPSIAQGEDGPPSQGGNAEGSLMEEVTLQPHNQDDQSAAQSCPEAERKKLVGVTASWSQCVRDGLLLFKSIPLTESHWLHVLRYNERAHVLSSEVSQWFWDSDLLKSMLRQVQRPAWGQPVHEARAPWLFTAIRRAGLVHWDTTEVTLYALDDLPQIVSTFNAPTALCEAVNRETARWQSDGLAYFTPVHNTQQREMEELQSELKELQLKRKHVLISMVEKSDDDTTLGSTPLEQLIEIEKAIATIKNKLTKLEKNEQPPVNQGGIAGELKPPVNQGGIAHELKPPEAQKMSDLAWISTSPSLSSSGSSSSLSTIPAEDRTSSSIVPPGFAPPSNAVLHPSQAKATTSPVPPSGNTSVQSANIYSESPLTSLETPASTLPGLKSRPSTLSSMPQQGQGSIPTTLPLTSMQQQSQGGIATTLPLTSMPQQSQGGIATTLPLTSMPQQGQGGIATTQPLSSMQQQSQGGIATTLPLSSMPQQSQGGIATTLPLSSMPQQSQGGIATTQPLSSTQRQDLDRIIASLTTDMANLETTVASAIGHASLTTPVASPTSFIGQTGINSLHHSQPRRAIGLGRGKPVRNANTKLPPQYTFPTTSVSFPKALATMHGVFPQSPLKSVGLGRSGDKAGRARSIGLGRGIGVCVGAEWQHIGHGRRTGGLPPIGSSAGLDII